MNRGHALTPAREDGDQHTSNSVNNAVLLPSENAVKAVAAGAKWRPHTSPFEALPPFKRSPGGRNLLQCRHVACRYGRSGRSTKEKRQRLMSKVAGKDITIDKKADIHRNRARRKDTACKESHRRKERKST